jgi:hypothetical protein
MIVSAPITRRPSGSASGSRSRFGVEIVDGCDRIRTERVLRAIGEEEFMPTTRVVIARPGKVACHAER